MNAATDLFPRLAGLDTLLADYSVAGLSVRQRIGEVGELCLRFHPLRNGYIGILEQVKALSAMLGEPAGCRVGEWEFAGSIQSISFSPNAPELELRILDGLHPLEGCINSRVFVRKKLREMVNSLGTGKEKYVFMGNTGDAQLPMAIQYQESDLAFLSNIVSLLGCNIWCSGSSIYIGAEGRSSDTRLSLSGDVDHCSLSIETGPESVDVISIPCDGGGVRKSREQLDGNGIGETVAAVANRRAKLPGFNSVHIVSDDANAQLVKALPNLLLNSGSAGRLRIVGTMETPLEIGQIVKLGEEGDGDNGSSENMMVAAIMGEFDFEDHRLAWRFEALPPNWIETAHSPRNGRLLISMATVEAPSNKKNRVQVAFPWDGNRSVTPWLRVAAQNWGKDHRHFVPMKKGDRVAVLWGQYDMDPIVLGALPIDQEALEADYLLQTIGGFSVSIDREKMVLGLDKKAVIEIQKGAIKLKANKIDLEAPKVDIK